MAFLYVLEEMCLKEIGSHGHKTFSLLHSIEDSAFLMNRKDSALLMNINLIKHKQICFVRFVHFPCGRNYILPSAFLENWAIKTISGAVKAQTCFSVLL